jgi:tripartite-type tricarboxylate transporter receptor subunit TctC
MVNLPSNDSTIFATASDSKFKTIEQVIDALKKDPKSISIGVQPASADLMNLALLLQAEKINIKDVRVVTFTGGGPARNAVLGGTVDVGLVGAEGFVPIKNRIRGLVLFDDQRDPEFADTPQIEEYAKKRSLSIEWVPGSQRGWVLPATLKSKYPDRHAILVKAITDASKDPEFIAAAKAQALPVTWLGPQKSQELYLKASNTLLKHIDIILAK